MKEVRLKKVVCLLDYYVTYLSMCRVLTEGYFLTFISF